MLVFTNYSIYTILLIKTAQDTYFLKKYEKDLLRFVPFFMERFDYQKYTLLITFQREVS
jgi:hypothetical protein